MLMRSELAWRTSKPASASRFTARSTSPASDAKLPTVVLSASTPASNIETPPSDRGLALAKIRSGKSLLRRGAAVVVADFLGADFFAVTPLRRAPAGPVALAFLAGMSYPLWIG